MAALWAAKRADEKVQRRWTVPLAHDDGISAVTAVSSDLTVTTDYEYEDAILTLSGGTVGVATVTVTVTTLNSLTLVETFYIGIDANTTETALEVCTFALAKIFGDGQPPNAAAMDNALEQLNGLLALWRMAGVDTGQTGTLISTDAIKAPEGVIAALKFKLRLLMHDHYSAPITPIVAAMADMAERAVFNSVVGLNDVAMPLSNRTGWYDGKTG